MSLNFAASAILCIVGLSIVNLGQCQGQDPSDTCLGCICQASTKCQRDIGCTEAGVCGPLLISWPFWADGGKYHLVGTDLNGNKAYSECANDLYCAAETVRGYMAKYKQDCNGDGRIDCEDYARIHKMGPASCTSPNFLSTQYYAEFSKCNQRFGGQ